ncbi:hypothetical protein ACEPAF_8096 [Sanghuangporus sanghuang]
MAHRNTSVIDVTSDEDSPPALSASRIQSITASTMHIPSNASVSLIKSTSRLPRSSILAGATYAFRGTWLTMTTEAAEELCKANGGEVTLAITARTQYVVMGGRGTTQDTKIFTEHGATLITEADFLRIILSQSGPNKENAHLSAGHKRPPEGSSSGPSKPSKVARKSESDLASEEEDMKWLHMFLKSDEVRLRGKTLVAYDCGGEVFRAKRGKSAVDLLRKFNKFLEDCQGVSFHRCRGVVHASE